MNTDVKDIFKRIKLRNPVAAAGIGLLIIAVVAFVLAAVSLGRNLLAASQAQADLAVVEDGIGQIMSLQTANPASLQAQIAEVDAQIAERLAGFPTSAEASDEAARFYEYAMQTDVQVISIEPLRSMPEEEAQDAYAVQRYYVVAQGAVPGLLRFVGRLGSRPVATLRLTDVAIYQSDGGRADIDLIVYASDRAISAKEGDAASDAATVADLEKQASEARDAGDWEAVVKYASRILESEPVHVEASLWLYEAYVAWGEELEAADLIELAREKFEAALDLRPEGQEALLGLERLSSP
jgi:tetratricopeptide (TPR) repeat protein